MTPALLTRMSSRPSWSTAVPTAGDQHALALIAERGVAALSVAGVARRTEVSGGAPYRHFPSRQALLPDVAFEAAAVARTMAEAQRNTPPR
jgi:AcrR family transcriptional regulator